jgi:hypothetical protein
MNDGGTFNPRRILLYWEDFAVGGAAFVVFGVIIGILLVWKFLERNSAAFAGNVAESQSKNLNQQQGPDEVGVRDLFCRINIMLHSKDCILWVMYGLTELHVLLA